MTACRPAARPGRTGHISADFVELICQDDDLVRAEFDALIAACWDTAPPPATPPALPRPAPRPPGWPVASASDIAPVPPAPPPPLGRRWNRQRSPPDHRTAIS